MKQTTLRPSDIVTALELAVRSGSTLAELAQRSAKSIGETHNAIRRLGLSALLLPDQRAVAVDALLQFIRWGVPYAFPAALGGPAVGWPTAILLPIGSAPTGVAGEGAGSANSAEYVWPSADGRVSGTALIPLYPGAPHLIDRNPQLATMLSYVDLVRVGGTRERDAAIDALGRMLRSRAP